MRLRRSLPAFAAALVLAACGADKQSPNSGEVSATTSEQPAATAAEDAADGGTGEDVSAENVTGEDVTGEDGTGEGGGETAETGDDGQMVSLRADVWADNWFSLWVNGEFVGEDSVPITTERSFNSESFTFEATLPLTIAVEAKDFKENDTGLEYIGSDRQQMGDGGLIIQVVDVATGDPVAVSDGAWRALVTHVAPLDPSCERSADPDTDCSFATAEAPAEWTVVGFDDSAWDSATVWSVDAVSPKDGYDTITWASDAAFVWGSDLETDNTVLLRATPGSGA